VLGELLSIVLPVYVCAGLGYSWVRAGRRYDTALITDLITNVGAPCLVFSSLVGIEVEGSAMLQMAGATLLALASFAAIASAILRLAGLPLTSFLAPMTFPNAGNMGLPICLFAFGDEGLALAVCFFATTALTHFTLGQWIWSGRVSATQLLRTPLAYSVALAAVVVASGVSVPEWTLRATTLLGGFTIPLMQFTLGVSLAELQVARIPRSLALAFLRLGMGAAVGVGLAWLLGVEGAMRGVLILQCSMPVAVFNYLLAERHGRTPADVASVVILSTIASFVTLPLLLAWIL
jgi:hypothetical protein